MPRRGTTLSPVLRTHYFHRVALWQSRGRDGGDVRRVLFGQAVLGRLIENRYPYLKLHLHDADTAANNAYLAAALYLLTMSVSLIVWVRGARQAPLLALPPSTYLPVRQASLHLS